MKETKVVLLLGPSGVGKSSIIDRIISRNPDFNYVSPYTTRKLRPGERNKVHVSEKRMTELDLGSGLLAVNSMYGVRYGTPIKPFYDAILSNRFPIIDWPVKKVAIMRREFGKKIISLYLEPPSLDELRSRLSMDGRDAEGTRINAAFLELNKYYSGEFDELIDFKLISENNKLDEIADTIVSVVKSGML